jgi:hypothetical protein
LGEGEGYIILGRIRERVRVRGGDGESTAHHNQVNRIASRRRLQVAKRLALPRCGMAAVNIDLVANVCAFECQDVPRQPAPFDMNHGENRDKQGEKVHIRECDIRLISRTRITRTLTLTLTLTLLDCLTRITRLQPQHHR